MVRGRLQHRDILEPPWIAQTGNHVALGKMDLPVVQARGRPQPLGQLILAPSGLLDVFGHVISRRLAPCCFVV